MLLSAYYLYMKQSQSWRQFEKKNCSLKWVKNECNSSRIEIFSLILTDFKLESLRKKAPANLSVISYCHSAKCRPETAPLEEKVQKMLYESKGKPEKCQRKVRTKSKEMFSLKFGRNSAFTVRDFCVKRQLFKV